MKRFLRSLGFAGNGLVLLLKHERNFQLHVVAFIAVCSAGFFFKITGLEWLVIILVSALVMGLEAMNTAIEKLCDVYTTETNEGIKKIKDIAAAAVLIAAVFAICIAVVVFLPYVTKVF
jgi:diacylglycerol kinase